MISYTYFKNYDIRHSIFLQASTSLGSRFLTTQLDISADSAASSEQVFSTCIPCYIHGLSRWLPTTNDLYSVSSLLSCYPYIKVSMVYGFKLSDAVISYFPAHFGFCPHIVVLQSGCSLTCPLATWEFRLSIVLPIRLRSR